MNTTFPLLDTARLRLRALTPADAPALLRIHSDAEAMRWFGVDPMQNIGQAEKIIDAFNAWFVASSGIRWGLELRDHPRNDPHDGVRDGTHHRTHHGTPSSGRLIGTCGLFRWNKNWSHCALGYELARTCHGRGYMREALIEVLNFGFTEMALHRVHAEIHRDNQASIRLAQGLGFRFEGVHRETAYWGERWHDLGSYSLLAQEWTNHSGQD